MKITVRVNGKEVISFTSEEILHELKRSLIPGDIIRTDCESEMNGENLSDVVTVMHADDLSA